MNRFGEMKYAALVAVGLIWFTWTSSAPAVECVIASVHPLATDAGLRAFEGGGNAVDAAIAAALTLGVVDAHNSGLGGGCFILIRRADGELVAIDGREKAPAGATRDMFLRNGKADPELSRTGPLASGVPGALAAYAMALTECGQRPLADLIAPAAALAAEGFRVNDVAARHLASETNDLARFDGSRAVLLHDDGSPYREGEMLKQPDLAATYRAIAEHGPEWFYRGAFAQRVGEWMAENGGVMTADDFAMYRARRREPLQTRYREWTIVGFPPPSSGGVHVAQMLNILESFDLKSIHRESPSRWSHLLVETMKLAFADRAYWLGDADFVDVPRGLIDKKYAAELAMHISLDRATPVADHGDPPRAASDLFERHTTHVTAADTDGNWAAITATVNTTYGSKVIVPGTGVVLNNEMDDFSAQPGAPNAFGLLGAENNAIQPGKRPLSSMSPTIVLEEGRPVLTAGAAGGPKIITQVVQTLVRFLDLEMSLADAVGAPRLHHQWRPDQVVAEAAIAEGVVDDLRRRGHEVVRIDRGGVTQAIGLEGRGELSAVHDPRVPGKTARGTRD